MVIACDPAKRDWTFLRRGLAFEDAVHVFAGRTYIVEDNRKDYGEVRYVTVGHLRGRMVIVCWTLRDGGRRVFSMRKANDREKKKFAQQLG